MPLSPSITVQLVHIHGPLKGQVNEFSQFPVHIGRHSSCHIRFDKEMTSISRQHARIECKGNRFRMVDVSTNGTFINGKRIANVYLRDGDVITFSDSGPKASFLTKIGAGSASIPIAQQRAELSTNPSDLLSQQSLDPRLTLGTDQTVHVFSTEVPLVIQYGGSRHHYNRLPIILGSDSECDFVIADDRLHGRHIQIFFSGENYYAEDLTGDKLITINGRSIETQAVLAHGAELFLTDKGPKFRFFSDGSLTEIQESTSEKGEKIKTAPTLSSPQKKLSISKKTKYIFKKFFK